MQPLRPHPVSKNLPTIKMNCHGSCIAHPTDSPGGFAGQPPTKPYSAAGPQPLDRRSRRPNPPPSPPTADQTRPQATTARNQTSTRSPALRRCPSRLESLAVAANHKPDPAQSPAADAAENWPIAESAA
jgi:hypothetical protein